MGTITGAQFNQIPRATHIASNTMQGTAIATLSGSASDELWLFPIPPNCFVLSGSIKGSVPSGTIGNTIVKLGTRESDNAFGTYTVSGTAVLATSLAIYSAVTVSTSGDVSPYQRAVIATINSQTTSTISLSLFVRLDYKMPGNV